jgi:ammonium transporter, Amt family
MRDREWRRYGKLLLAGKLMGIGLVVGVLFLGPDLIGWTTFAADADLKGNDIVNPINTVWVLVAAFLVFAMQVGFTMLEAGFCRSRETVNVLMECIVDTCLCGLLFYAIGFAFMFSHGNGFIGYHWFFLRDIPATYESTGVAFLAFWLFQFAFADTCSTITSGAMIGRTSFVGDLLYSVAVSGFRLSATGRGVRMAFWPRWEPPEISCRRSVWAFTILRDPPSCTPSADLSRSPARSSLVLVWGANSNETAGDRCCLTI